MASQRLCVRLFVWKHTDFSLLNLMLSSLVNHFSVGVHALKPDCVCMLKPHFWSESSVLYKLCQFLIYCLYFFQRQPIDSATECRAVALFLRLISQSGWSIWQMAAYIHEFLLSVVWWQFIVYRSFVPPHSPVPRPFPSRLSQHPFKTSRCHSID